MIKWLKTLFRIVRTFDEENQAIKGCIQSVDSRYHNECVSLHDMFKDRTTVAVDVHYKCATSIIIVGRYRNRDYVRTFNLDIDNIDSLIEQLIHMEKNYGKVRYIDSPPSMRAIIDHELKKWVLK